MEAIKKESDFSCFLRHLSGMRPRRVPVLRGSPELLPDVPGKLRGEAAAEEQVRREDDEAGRVK